MKTEIEVEATARPWECPGSDGEEWVICTHKSKGRRKTLAHVYSKGDVLLIVQAVNNHQALVDAASFARSVLKTNPVELSERMAIEKLDAALAGVSVSNALTNREEKWKWKRSQTTTTS